ncbi:hypothetical protein EXIGLDRAFT_220048 [Exidia glandulosa HHB12029]|uniref:Uncharacterized protein n=1 Tax=Exidia glandulosa HHB12029 TaxID=1314781 RepID=A0A165MP20_EXIGL|nr:hypothetical protein EXIGLDRAFT_220048 [Exidia glandulosa HHB12029]
MLPNRHSPSANSPYSQYSDEGSPPGSASGHTHANMSTGSTAHLSHHQRAPVSQNYNTFPASQFATYPSSPASSSGSGGHTYTDSPHFTSSLAAFHEDIKPMFAGGNYGQIPGTSAETLQLRQQVTELQAMVTQLQAERGQLYRELSAVGAPAHPAFMQPMFHQDWHRRTEARKKLICASNRAGNTLCAWHDSRRERRAYPPRMAPNGMLNCGCSEEEALFEESLARNGVGSYRPAGDQVRMDPGLRKPLLDLLKRRYGYKDGDFEIDVTSGTWRDEEDGNAWENRLRTSRRP